MLKPTLSVILISCWIVGTSSAATDPFVGKWKLNSAQTKIADQMSIQSLGQNKYGLSFIGVGEPETVTADGSDQPGVAGTMLSVKIEDPNTWKIVRKKDGRTLLTATWKLSADGKTLSDAFTSNQADGSTSTINMLYKRTAGDSGIPGTWETTDVKVGTGIEMEIKPYDTDGLSFVSSASPAAKNIKFDGQEHLDPATGTSLGVAFLGRKIDQRNLEYTSKIKGKIVDTRQLTLSPDLKTLTMTIHPTGQRLPNTLVFDRE
ncbi:MAG TPA: hypothetical protein VJ721_01955 [Chthoniobacterales bacterium]|nr:hypothetical protein [Chthoniobacterales bacterium]